MGTNFNYDDTSHQIIFDNINGGAASDPLQQASQGWQRLRDSVGTTGKSYVQGVIRTILGTREGAAAQAAAEAIGAMVPWIDDVARIATSAAQRAQGQADHWATAKNSIPPVPPVPYSASFLSDPTEWVAQKMDWIPGLTTEEEKGQQRQQDAAEQARQAMRVYQSSSNGIIDQPPAFTAPQALENNLGSLPLTSAHVDGAGAAPSVVGGGAVGGSGHAALAAHPLAAHQPAAPQPAAHQPAAYQPAATTSQLAPGGPAGGGSVAAGLDRGPGYPTTGQGVSPGLMPVGTGFGAGSARRGPASPVRGAAAAARFPGTGGAGRSGFGPRPSSGFGPRPTVSAHPSAEGVARSSTASTARGASAQPFAGGGGTAQRGEQDREHRAKYLVHDDSHSIVGDLPPTAPPVIGTDPDY